MPRARNIKPAFFTNELLGETDPFVNLTFIGLWCLADRTGTLEDRPARIKAEIFPYRDDVDVNGYLTVLEDLGFLERYIFEGKKYIYIFNFEKHQRPHHTEKPKNFPRAPSMPLILNENKSEPLNNGYITVQERSDLLNVECGMRNVESGNPAASQPKKKNAADAEFEKLLDGIISEWNEIIDFAPSITSKTKSRIAAVKTICEQNEKMNLIESWRKFFTHIRKSDFLSGRNGKSKTVFSFDWVIHEDNFAKIIEGNYDNE